MKRFILYFFIVFVLFSCTENETQTPSGKYSHGIWVVNEGVFGKNNGEISFITAEGVVENDIFSNNNASNILGDVVQSMTIVGENAYVVVNGSNKVEILDAQTFKSKTTLSALQLPRYLVAYGSKGFVSEWVSYTEKGRISIFDLATNKIEKNIEVGTGAEKMLIHDNFLFVTNSFENTISVINLDKEKVEKTIQVAQNPKTMLLDNNKIWVICGGGYDEDYNPNHDGYIYSIDSKNFTKDSIALKINVSGSLAIKDEKLFFYSNQMIYTLNSNDKQFSEWKKFEEITSIYGLAIKNNDLYVFDAKAFQVKGKVFKIDISSKEIISKYDVGFAPNSLIFN